MGYVYADARVFARRSVQVRFLVDTGATYTILAPSVAQRIGAIPLSNRFRASRGCGGESRGEVRVSEIRRSVTHEDG